jgi:hypothetical protein
MRDDQPMIAILKKVIEAYREARFLAGLNADYARLRQDPAAWAEEVQERAVWDRALLDGLED